MKKHGIENIKSTLKEVLHVAQPIIDALEDGKISLTELFSVAPRLMSIPKIVNSAKASLAELKDLDAEEIREIAIFFEKEFDIPQDDLEGKIEEAIFLLSDSYAVVADGIEVFQRWKSWAENIKAA